MRMSSSPSAKSEKKRKAEDVTEEAGDGAGAMDADAKKAEEKKKKAEEKKKKKAKRPGLDQCRRRVQKELAEISLDPPANISAGPKGDNLCEWVRSSWHMLVLYRGCSVHSLACQLDTCLQVATIHRLPRLWVQRAHPTKEVCFSSISSSRETIPSNHRRLLSGPEFTTATSTAMEVFAWTF